MQESTISPELLAILVCPDTKQALNLATTEDLFRINALIAEGRIVNKAGRTIKENICAGLVREDAKIIYPIVDGIPVMLSEEGLVIGQ